MAILSHRSAAMSVIYTRICDPEIRRQYEATFAGSQGIAGPAPTPCSTTHSTSRACTGGPPHDSPQANRSIHL